MTQTQAKKAEIDAAREAMRAEYRKVIAAEFKPGVKVKWQHGLKQIEGTVVGLQRWEWSDTVEVVNDKSGAHWAKPAHELDLV